MALSLFRRRTEPVVDPAHIAVEHAGVTFQVAVRRRPAARRMTLRVSGTTGEIILTLPSRAPLRTAQDFVAAHGGWIATRVARIPDRIAFRPGKLVPLRGLPHRIVHGSAGRGATVARVEGGEAILEVFGDEAGVPGRVRRFLAAEATRDLAEAVRRYTGLLGIPASRVTLRDTRSRWGSCSSTGALSFSWRLIMAPAFVLDYLAAHEVAHLKEMNHSPRYWALTRSLCPRTDEAEAWLKRHGHSLHHYG
jgi:predicted metal-dependent hydrolase